MALTESINIEIGKIMPAFKLKTPDLKIYSNKKLMGKNGLLVLFTCNHCPYSKALWPKLLKVEETIKFNGINIVAINPNINPDFPEDAPGKMIEMIHKLNIKFPYLIDYDQTTALLYRARCTPDLYLLDSDMGLVYHGRFDDNWMDDSLVTRRDLIIAVKALARRLPLTIKQIPSIGCSIKWKNNLTIKEITDAERQLFVKEAYA